MLVEIKQGWVVFFEMVLYLFNILLMFIFMYLDLQIGQIYNKNSRFNLMFLINIFMLDNLILYFIYFFYDRGQIIFLYLICKFFIILLVVVVLVFQGNKDIEF